MTTTETSAQSQRHCSQPLHLFSDWTSKIWPEKTCEYTSNQDVVLKGNEHLAEVTRRAEPGYIEPTPPGSIYRRATQIQKYIFKRYIEPII